MLPRSKTSTQRMPATPGGSLENQAPSSVNNGARALEGLLARFYVDLGCRISTGGSANAYTFAASQAVTSYYDGLILCFDASFQNTDNATLNVDAQGAITLYRNGAEIPAGTIEKDQKVLVTYDGTNFEVLSVARGITTYTDPITTRGDIIRGDSSGNVERLAVGNADEILGTDGTDAAWRAITSYVAVQADLEGASAVTAYTSPGRQQLHPSAAKVWGNVDRSAGTPSLQSPSFNVTSVTDNGAGSTIITIATDFSSAIYSAGALAWNVNQTGDGTIGVIQTVGVTSFVVTMIDHAGTLEDTEDFSFWAFGDQ